MIITSQNSRINICNIGALKGLISISTIHGELVYENQFQEEDICVDVYTTGLYLISIYNHLDDKKITLKALVSGN